MAKLNDLVPAARAFALLHGKLAATVVHADTDTDPWTDTPIRYGAKVTGPLMVRSIGPDVMLVDGEGNIARTSKGAPLYMGTDPAEAHRIGLEFNRIAHINRGPCAFTASRNGWGPDWWRAEQKQDAEAQKVLDRHLAAAQKQAAKNRLNAKTLKT